MKKVLPNVEFFWPNVKEVDNYGKYSVKCFLSPTAIDILNEYGVGNKIKTDKINSKGNVDKEGAPFIMLRRAADLNAPEVVDANKESISELIGNGSKGNVLVDIYQYKANGGGTAIRLEKLQVLELVVYSTDEDFEDYGGSSEEEETF